MNCTPHRSRAEPGAPTRVPHAWIVTRVRLGSTGSQPHRQQPQCSLATPASGTQPACMPARMHPYRPCGLAAPRQVLRDVDTTRKHLDGVPGVVQRIEADPNRSGFLALVKYSPGRPGWLRDSPAQRLLQQSW
jgi:ribosomal protein L2